MKTYVVRMRNGYYEATSKKDAVEFLNSTEKAEDIILSQSKQKNYWHDRVNIIMTK
jgi:hypothetical protein